MCSWWSNNLVVLKIINRYFWLFLVKIFNPNREFLMSDILSVESHAHRVSTMIQASLGIPNMIAILLHVCTTSVDWRTLELMRLMRPGACHCRDHMARSKHLIQAPAGWKSPPKFLLNVFNASGRRAPTIPSE